MKNRSKILLALLIVLTLMVGMFAINASAADNGTTLYLTPNSNWKIDNARFAIYFWNDSGNNWVSMSDKDGDGVYEAVVPSGYTNIIFCRMNPSATANNWNNKWNQTADLTIPTNGNNHYTVKSGTWDKGGGTWKHTHVKEVLPAVDATCENAGLTEGVKCSACGVTITAQQTVPSLPHNYEYGVCSECGDVNVTALSGAGTEADPYTIHNVHELVFFRDSVNSTNTKYNAQGVYVALAADIDMADVDWSVNIGDAADYSFDGIFDGKNFKIKNLNSTETAKDPFGYVCTGLFGCIAGEAQIKNLTLENVSIDATFAGNNAGALVGFVWNGSGSIENVTVCGNVNINAPSVYGVGAIVGYSYYNNGFEITNCKVVADEGSNITAKSGVGGIIGYTNGDVITGCEVSNLSIGANSIVGGISGTTLNVVVNNVSVNNVTLSATHENWLNSTGVVAGCFSNNSVNISNVTSNNVSGANREVGSEYAEQPSAPVAAAVAKIGGAYYTSLEAAIAVGGNITLVGDAAIDAMIVIPAGAEVVLDLNGYTITGTDTTSKNFSIIDNRGTLTIEDSVGTGKITLVATINSGWNRYSAVIANNPGGKLTVNGGTIQHLGGTDMAYGIDNLTNGKGTYAEVVINGGVVKSTYRAIRQFLNGVEAQNILTINGGVIEGDNKSVWMQDPSANANTGTLVIGSGAQLNGDVYLDVTVGSTSWPVSVSIDASAVNGEVLTDNVPAGYEVANVGGSYGVYTGVAKIGATYFDSLKDAIAAAQAGDTITLLSNAEVSGTINLNKSITINGNGNKIVPSANYSYNGSNAMFDIMSNATITFENITFDGINGSAIMRTVSANVVMDNCVIQNCVQTVSQGLLRLACGNATIVNSKFLNNNCKMVITFGYDAANNADVLLVDNCTFENNTCGDTAVVYFAAGDYGKVTNTKFVNNSVSATGNAATLYFGWGDGFEISGCTFDGNSVVTSHATTKRFASAIFCDGCTVTGNVFTNNTAVRNGETITTVVAVGAYYGAADVSENYWGGNAPVPGVDYTVEYSRNPVAAESYYASEDVSGEATVINYVAKSGVYSYTSLAAAFAAAKNGNTITLLDNITIDSETFTIADGVSLTLDMNGKKITVTDNKTSNYELFYIYGELTVTGNGTIELTATNNRAWNAMSAIFHNRGGVLTIENGTYTNLGGTDMAFVIDNSGNYYGDAYTYINGGTLYSTYTAIRNRMEQNAHGASGTAYLYIINGKIDGVTSAIWAQAASTSTTAPATGEISISGGEIGVVNTARSAGAVSMTTISGGTVASFKGEIGELTVNGGTITGDILVYTASNEAVNDFTFNADGLLVSAVAKVGDVCYASVLEALKAAIDSGASELIILSDSREKMTADFDFIINANLTITAASPVKVEFYNEGTAYDFAVGSTNSNVLTIGENVHFDLVDRVIWLGYWGNNVDVMVDGYLGGYQIWHGADTTVSATGKLDSHGEAFIMRRDATLTVNAGTVNANYFHIYSGHINAEDATITAGLVWVYNNHSYGSEGTVSFALDNTSFASKGEVKVYAGENKPVSITLSNGTNFTAKGAMTTNADVKIIVEVADANDNVQFTTSNMAAFAGNVEVVNTGDTAFVGKVTDKGVVLVAAVAQVGTSYYATVTEAIAAAIDGDTITLLSNIDLGTDCVTVKGKELTINLNGYNIIGSGYRVLFVDLLRVNNADKRGVLTLVGEGTVENIGTNGGNSYAVYVGGSSDLIVCDNVTVKSANGYAVVMLPMGAGRTSTLTVNGGTITGRYAVSGNGALTDTSTSVTVNGGSIIGTEVAIYQPQPGSVAVNGGTITGGSEVAIALRRGEATITGGTVAGLVDVLGDFEATSLEITGGDFSGASIKLATGNDLTIAEDVVIPNIDAVARIGTVYYATVTEALWAAVDGDVITLLPGTISEEIKHSDHIARFGNKNITIVGAENYGTILTGGIYIGYDDSTSYNGGVAIKGIVFNGKGISLYNLDAVSVEDCKFNNVEENAIYVVSDGSTVLTTVKGNVINGAVQGIRVRNALGLDIDANYISNTQENAITIEQGEGYNANNYPITITNNTIENWGLCGEGRAIRIALGKVAMTRTGSGSGAKEVVISGNILINDNAPEDFIKMTDVDATMDVVLEDNLFEGTVAEDKEFILLEGSGAADVDTSSNVSVTNSEPHIKDGNWWIGATDTGVNAGIAGIEVSGTSTDGLVVTYKITYSNGTEFYFDVKNGNGIKNIELVDTSDNGLEVTYRINYADGTYFDFVVKNGNGIDKIELIDTSADGLVLTYKITYTNGNTFEYVVKNGNGIKEIVCVGTSANGLEVTYKVIYNDGTEFQYVVKNGNGIVSIEEVNVSANGLEVTYRINYADGTYFDFVVNNGNGIDKIEKISTSADGLVDTYKITYTNGDTFEFTVYNGVSIVNAEINENYELVLTLADGQVLNLGSIKGDKGVSFAGLVKDTENSDDLLSIYYVSYVDHEGNVTVDKTKPIYVRNGAQGAPGQDGEKGDQGEKGERGERGEKGEKGDGNEEVVAIAFAVAAASVILALGVILYRGVRRRSWWNAN